MKEIFNKIIKSWNKFWNTPVTNEWVCLFFDILLYATNPTSYTINKLKH